MKSKAFYKLKAGDRVNHRRILSVKKIKGKTYFITLKKICPSGYSGENTIYVSGDSKVFTKTKS
jgi:hypothetical protein